MYTGDPRDESDNDMGDASHATTQKLALISKHNQRIIKGGILISCVSLIESNRDQNNGK
jgi:hypothetical protein